VEIQEEILLNLFLYTKHPFSLLCYVTLLNNPPRYPKQVFLGTCGQITGFARPANTVGCCLAFISQ